MAETKRNEDGVDLETGSVTSLDVRSQLGSDIHILGINYFKNNFGCFPCVNRYSLNDLTIIFFLKCFIFFFIFYLKFCFA